MASGQDSKSGKAPGQVQPMVRWDDSHAHVSYANVCNVACTREEMTLLLGVQQNWHPTRGELTVRLENRVMLSPWAAKRLAVLLSNAVGQYEARFGELTLEAPGGEGAPKTPRRAAS